MGQDQSAVSSGSLRLKKGIGRAGSKLFSPDAFEENRFGPVRTLSRVEKEFVQHLVEDDWESNFVAPPKYEQVINCLKYCDRNRDSVVPADEFCASLARVVAHGDDHRMQRSTSLITFVYEDFLAGCDDREHLLVALHNSASMTVQLFVEMSRLRGLDFLKKCLPPILAASRDAHAAQSSSTYNFNSSKYIVAQVAEKLVLTLDEDVNIKQRLPYEIRSFINGFLEMVDVQFPISEEGRSSRKVKQERRDLHRRITGAFFFNHFLNPGLRDPVNFGITTEEPSPASRKGLDLIVSILEHFAEGIEFEHKPFDFFNTFLADWGPRIDELLDMIPMVPAAPRRRRTSEDDSLLLQRTNSGNSVTVADGKQSLRMSRMKKLSETDFIPRSVYLSDILVCYRVNEERLRSSMTKSMSGLGLSADVGSLPPPDLSSDPLERAREARAEGERSGHAVRSSSGSSRSRGEAKDRDRDRERSRDESRRRDRGRRDRDSRHEHPRDRDDGHHERDRRDKDDRPRRYHDRDHHHHGRDHGDRHDDRDKDRDRSGKSGDRGKERRHRSRHDSDNHSRHEHHSDSRDRDHVREKSGADEGEKAERPKLVPERVESCVISVKEKRDGIDRMVRLVGANHEDNVDDLAPPRLSSGMIAPIDHTRLESEEFWRSVEDDDDDGGALECDSDSGEEDVWGNRGLRHLTHLKAQDSTLHLDVRDLLKSPRRSDKDVQPPRSSGLSTHHHSHSRSIG